MKTHLAGAACVAAILFAASASQAATYIWTFSDSADHASGSGQFTTTGSNVTSVSGAIDTAFGVDHIATLLANPTPGAAAISADGNWQFDNVYPLNINGLLFAGASGDVYNLWSTGGAGGDLGHSAGTVGGYYIDAGALTITAVPEAATWAMMILGLGGIGAVLRRRNQIAAAAASPIVDGPTQDL